MWNAEADDGISSRRRLQVIMSAGGLAFAGRVAANDDRAKHYRHPQLRTQSRVSRGAVPQLCVQRNGLPANQLTGAQTQGAVKQRAAKPV